MSNFSYSCTAAVRKDMYINPLKHSQHIHFVHSFTVVIANDLYFPTATLLCCHLTLEK